MSNRIAPFEYAASSVTEVIRDVRILIVDDDDILRGVHEAVLSHAGYGTNSAADGEEALALLAADDFDLILTDCNMPRLDGLGLIRAIRASGNRIPIMMVSSSLLEGGLPDDVRAEVAVALPKPVRTLELLAGVAIALQTGPRGQPPRLNLTISVTNNWSEHDEHSSNR